MSSRSRSGRQGLGLSTAIAIAAIAGGAAVSGAHGQGAVVARRLSTGSTSSGARDGLPQAWVAPAPEAPRIDGRIDEPAWSAAAPFVLGRLESRGTVEPRTEIRLVHRDGMLYLAASCAEPTPAGMRRSSVEPDGKTYEDDSIEVFLSPAPEDGYTQLVVSSTGAIFDRQNREDPASFDAGAKAVARVEGEGWTVEVSIPLRSLGIHGAVPLRWRANMYRNRYAAGPAQSQAWSPTLRGDYDVPERFGHLLFTPEPPWAKQAETARRQAGIEVRERGDGSAVLTFDLGAIPRGAKVLRATLRCERAPLDLAEPQAPGAVEITSGEGASIAATEPWYRSFDLTELVENWSSGARPKPEVLVRGFSSLKKEKTFLDVWYEGEPADVPPPVSGLRAFHRAGQTFIAWKEIGDPVGRDEVRWGELKRILDDLDREREIRYAILRSARPITRETLAEAREIAIVEPLSGWNINGRNIDRPIDEFIATAEILRWHQWNPFQNATVDGEYGRDCPIDRLVVEDGEQPLARGTGLYVHTAAAGERAYYAVLAQVDGIVNGRDIGDGNSLAEPIEERVAEPVPVLQRELPRMPFFNYDQRRLHFVQFIGPPLSNRPYEYHNWSAGVPNDLGARPAPGVPLELNLHRDGSSYWRTHYRIEPGSIVLCPYDFPLKTWWYGYPEAWGTLRSWAAVPVRNYTERRLLAAVQWACKRWPIDRDRILVTGCRGGASGSGALHVGLRYPDVFAMVIAGHGDSDHRSVGKAAEDLWGRAAWSLKAESGRTVWDELDLVRHVKELPASVDLPFVSMTYDERQKGADRLVGALMEKGWAVISHTAWGGERLVPVSARATSSAVRLDIRKDRPLLAVSAAGKVGDAVRNGSILWRGDDVVDEPGAFAMTFRQTGGDFEGALAVRRVQRFALKPGASYGVRIEGGAQPIATAVRVEDAGVLRIPSLTLAPGTYRLSVAPEEGQE